MKNDEKTIVAIATPIGSAGVGIVRLSGEKSLVIAKKMFNKNIEQPRYMYLGKIKTDKLDEHGFVVYFKAPHSYTGEDVVEFQVHGGIMIVNEIVKQCLNFGATMAERGEFTKRAFMNGKLSLNEAESLMDYINAQSNAELIASKNLINGAFSAQINNFIDYLKDCLAQINVTLDYPEHDDELKTAEKIKGLLENLNCEIGKLIDSYNYGRLVKNGINVCLVGQPNVGKSSIMNGLMNCDVAIVTDIAGTTTDAIKDSYIYKDMRFNIVDTAGIRESENAIEKIGIERTKQNVAVSDLVLGVFDCTNLSNLNAILDETKDKKRLLVFNKLDLINQQNFEENIKKTLKNEHFIIISAKNSDDILKLKEKIFEITVSKEFNLDANIVLNQRHYELLNLARKDIARAIDNIDFVTLDCVACDIMDAFSALSAIVGYGDIEDIIDTIFSKFCLGK